MQNISGLDATICLGYLALVVGLGLYFSNKQKDNDDFFLGGRKMHWLPVGLSLFAGTFSSNSFVGLPLEIITSFWRFILFRLSSFRLPVSGLFPFTSIWDIPVFTSISSVDSIVRSD